MSVERREVVRPDAIFGPHERPLAATVAHFRSEIDELSEDLGAELEATLEDMAAALAGIDEGIR